MAFTSIGSLGTVGSAGTTSSTLVIPAFSASIGDVLVAFVAGDNVGTTDADGNEITGITDQAGNTWTKIGEWRNGQGAANAGTVVAIFLCQVTIAISSQTATVQFANSVGERACRLWEFSVGAGSTVQQAGSLQQTAADASTNPGSQTVSGLTSKEYLFIRGVSMELNSTTAVTVTANFTAITTTRSRNQAAAQAVAGEFRIVTATSQTSGGPPLTLPGSCDSASLFFALEEIPAAPGELPILVAPRMVA